jgi:P4 family phage/plasmid primase-like protien
MATLQSFLDSHRVEKGGEWNLTGMGRFDSGRYFVSDAEYDTFLGLVHSSIFGAHRRASSLLEKHLANGPLLIDLDFRYASDGRPLERRFTIDHIHQFIGAYASALARFVDITRLPNDLSFYILTKPAPEHDKDQHKDGVHIQCPNITTDPQLQFAIRGYLLEQNAIQTIFGETGLINEPTDCYDVSVIHQNNWFLYGACKPDKSQYKVQEVISIPRSELTGLSLTEIPEAILNAMEEGDAPKTPLEIIKLLSIRRGHAEKTNYIIREETAAEYRTLLTTWGHGKAVPLRSAHSAPSAVLRHEPRDHGETASDAGSELLGAPTNEDDIHLAYRYVKECLDPEKRCGEYHDWVILAICLKNISDSEESFAAWCDITRRVKSHHKKASYTEAELKTKWNKVTAGRHDHPVRFASLQYWAKMDNYEAYDAILSENNRKWIIDSASDTHVNVAKFVYKLYKSEFSCSLGAKRGAPEWFQFVGHSWKHLRSPNVLRARLSDEVWKQYMKADQHIGDIMISCKESEREGWEKKRKFIGKIRAKLENSGFKDSVLKECAEQFYDEEFIHKLNTNPILLGASNGVLELRHWDNEDKLGSPRVFFRDGRPDDYITFQMGRCESELGAIPYEPYDPTAPTPVHKAILEFYKKIYPDPDLREYVMTLDAACLEGENREQRFYFEQGRGSNGKSMKQTIKRYTFGDYATSLQTTALTRKRPDSGAANPDMIVTKGKRYIYGGEPDNGEKLNSARMKQMSGEDIVEARGLFSDQEKFKMMGKIFLACNDLPPVSSMDDGTWRRIRVILHSTTFVDADKPEDPEQFVFHKDLDLSEKMKQASWRIAYFGILVYYFESRYLKFGLREPESVKAASQKYKQENDTFTAFATDNLVVESGAGPVKLADILTRYKEWKKAMPGVTEMKKAMIIERMKSIAARGSTEVEFKGVRLREELEDLSGVVIAANTLSHIL